MQVIVMDIGISASLHIYFYRTINIFCFQEFFNNVLHLTNTKS